MYSLHYLTVGAEAANYTAVLAKQMRLRNTDDFEQVDNEKTT